jgi:hypothetical protein
MYLPHYKDGRWDMGKLTSKYVIKNCYYNNYLVFLHTGWKYFFEV